jgi:hypothetical protein
MKPETLRVILVAVILPGAFWGGYDIGSHHSQSDLEAEYLRGCADCSQLVADATIKIIDTKIYEDTILMGWIVRQPSDPADTIPAVEYDSLGRDSIIKSMYPSGGIWIE